MRTSWTLRGGQGVYRSAMLKMQTCHVPAIALYEQTASHPAGYLCEYTNDDVQNREARIDLFLPI